MPFYQLPTGGSPVLAGNAPPTGGIGNDGDLFLDRVGRTLYGPKQAGSWPTGIDLSLGPAGPAGSTGAAGATGASITGPTGAASNVTGPTGSTGAASTVTGPTGGIAFSVGATAPTAPGLTVAGAVWLDASTGRYFVRYENQFIEIGVQGERGPTGVTGAASTVPGPTGAASNVTGPTGSTGGIAFSATGPTAPAGATLTIAGAVWLDASTGRYFVRYESNWIEIGVQGERGPTGPAGATAIGLVITFQ